MHLSILRGDGLGWGVLTFPKLFAKNPHPMTMMLAQICHSGASTLLLIVHSLHMVSNVPHPCPCAVVKLSNHAQAKYQNHHSALPLP